MTLGRLEKWKPDEESEIAYYKQLLRKTPNKYSLLNFLANALYKQAEYEEAIHCWLKFIRKQKVKEVFRILIKVAQAFEAMGEIEYAFHYYGEAVKSSDNNLDAIGKFGQMAYILENYDDAVESFEYITRNEPYNEIAWHNLGLTYYNLGYHNEAIDSLELSLSLDDESADSWYTLATIYSESYQLDEAIYSLEKSLEIDPSLREMARQEQSFYSLTGLSMFKLLLNL